MACLLAPTYTTAGQDDLNQVLVEGSRAKLREMRMEIERLEDQFYSRYNELNSVDDFDVHCGREARTGTQIRRRYCRAVFENKALQEEGRRAFEFSQYIREQFVAGVPNPKVNGGPPVQAIVAIELRRPEYRENLKKVVSGDSELGALLQERARLLEMYNSLLRRTSPPP